MGGIANVIRVDRKELTRSEIVRVAAKCFLNDGYTKTTINSMCKKLNMSPGNMTFHFPTKEHMLAELVDMLGRYQWKMMEDEATDGHSSITAICLELLTIASACEQDECSSQHLPLASASADLHCVILQEPYISTKKTKISHQCTLQ